ncbi:MAG: DUF309 domain-containing protein [Desulfobacterales bacterium]|nr:MAG: DUF309 domain-containing protein [Desulfobacterales bacterium]
MAIHSGDIGPSRAVAEKYLSKETEPFINSYINNRLTRYEAIISQIQSANIQIHETYIIALLLWDQELFFEFHEWLEQKWLNSKGAEKIKSQALIRAACTYIHLEHGRNEGAKKTASKAMANLIRHKELVPAFFNVELLVAKLKALDPVPPKLGATEFIAKIATN